MRLTIFDVEHGACALLECDNGNRMMIDCGHNASSGWKPGNYLAARGITHLEYLVITNYDEDHVSGLPNLLSRVTIGILIRNPTVSGTDLKKLKSEDGMGAGIDLLSSFIPQYANAGAPQPVLPSVQWRVFWNPYPYFDDENNLSLVLFLTIQGIGFLFPGDLEDKGWKNLLGTVTTFPSAVAATNVLVASHHGRENGICEDIFDTHSCKPSIVVISDDYHQYDTQKTCEYYRSKCSGMTGDFRGQGKRFVLTTRNDGTLTFNWKGTSCVLS